MARKAKGDTSARAGRILFVDDEPGVVEPLVDLARSLGFEAMVLDDAGQLVATLESFAPTHVVVDLVMPEVDGIDVLLALSRRQARPRIIVISGYHWGVIESARILAESHALTDIGWLSKPIDLDRFEALLQRSPTD